MNLDFSNIAPYLQDPLVLIGFFLFLAFSFSRYIIKKGLIPPLPKTLGYKILKTILLYGFIFGILIAILGFSLKYQELRNKESIAPLKEPRIISCLNNAGDYEYLKASYLNSAEQADNNISESKGLQVDRILQGQSKDKSSLIFDLILLNHTTAEIVPEEFVLVYKYIPGRFGNIEEGALLKPIAEYLIDFPLDTSNKTVRAFSKPVYPIFTIPAKTRNVPGRTSIRLQLGYHFTGRLSYHPYAKWTIQFSLILKAKDSGLTIFPTTETVSNYKKRIREAPTEDRKYYIEDHNKWNKDYVSQFPSWTMAKNLIGANYWQNWSDLIYIEGQKNR